MEFLAGAFVLIFVLHLIDKRNCWRQTFKIAVAVVGLCVLAVGGYFGWQQYQGKRQAQADAAVQAAQISACISRLQDHYRQDQHDHPLKGFVVTAPPDFKSACLADPLTTLVPPDSVESLPVKPMKSKSEFDFSDLGDIVRPAH